MRRRTALQIALMVVIGIVLACGGGGGGGGGESAATPQQQAETAQFFPADMAVASPTDRGSSSSASSRAAPGAFGGEIDRINAILNGTTAGACAFDPARLQREALDAGCYGPIVSYENHPDAPTPNSGALPTGDVGIWTENEGATGEACAAAQLNSRMRGISGMVNAALATAASMVCVVNAAGLELPSNSTLDLTSRMNTAAADWPGTISFDSARITHAAPAGRAEWTYTLDFTFTNPATGASFPTFVELYHIQGCQRGDYEGRLWFQFQDTRTSGNCVVPPATSSAVTRAGSLLYRKYSGQAVTIDARSATFCGADGDPFQSGLVDPMNSFDPVARPKGWGNDFDLFRADFDPTTMAGQYSYSWQAGAQDSHSRVLNVGLITDGTSNTLTGAAFFGYGDPVQSTHGLIRGFICNWAGPGGAVPAGNPAVMPLVQAQYLSQSSGLFVSDTARLAIDYAPTNNCNYDGAGSFRFDSDGDGTIDTDPAVAVTHDLAPIAAAYGTPISAAMAPGNVLAVPPCDNDAQLLNVGAKPVPAGATLADTPTSLTIQLRAEGHRILGQGAPEGVSVREGVLGSENLGSPVIGRAGEPNIAGRVVRVLLPYDANLQGDISVQFSGVQTELIGTFDVRPIGRTVSYDLETDVESVAPLPPGVQLDGAGRDPAIYGQNSQWPATPVSILETSRLRQYKIVQVQFNPFLWNPVTQELQKITQIDVQISWTEMVSDDTAILLDLSDPVRVPNLELSIYNTINIAWYILGAGDIRREGVYDYVIITTNTIYNDSSRLWSFVDHKEDLGFSVAVVRVEAIKAYYPASELADSIREFLMDKYSDWGIEYVLLVGDPDPYDRNVGSTDDIGSVPMGMAWLYGPSAVNGVPTDHYYGDLSDEWDVDGDGYAADDEDTSGFDFDMEVKVGRVPFDDVDDIDRVFLMTWLYELMDVDHDRINLANSFFASDTDYSHLGRQIHSEFFSSGYTVITFYQQNATTGSDSPYSSTYDLTDLALVHHWQSYAPGLVIWSGHGSSTTVAIGYSPWGSSTDEGTLMSTSYTSTLISASFVVQLSCANAWPETSGNLAHSMLEDYMITTVAASRNTWYTHEQEDFGTSYTIGDVGYWVARSHSYLWSAGYAIQSMRSRISGSGDYPEVNRMAYNLYGDPSVHYKPE